MFKRKPGARGLSDPWCETSVPRPHDGSRVLRLQGQVQTGRPARGRRLPAVLAAVPAGRRVPQSVRGKGTESSGVTLGAVLQTGSPGMLGNRALPLLSVAAPRLPPPCTLPGGQSLPGARHTTLRDSSGRPVRQGSRRALLRGFPPPSLLLRTLQNEERPGLPGGPHARRPREPRQRAVCERVSRPLPAHALRHTRRDRSCSPGTPIASLQPLCFPGS